MAEEVVEVFDFVEAQPSTKMRIYKEKQFKPHEEKVVFIVAAFLVGTAVGIVLLFFLQRLGS